MQKDFFKNKKPNIEKLKKAGFKKVKDFYDKSFDLTDGAFSLHISIDKAGNLKTQITEKATNELYTLHLAEGVNGAFVNTIRNEYNRILEDISKKYFDMDVFLEKDTIDVIEYSKKKYKSKVEYLWEKFPRNAVLRRADNKKWYAAILTVKKSKLGLKGDEIVEVLNIRALKEDVPLLIEKDGIYPAYHMNKKSWITIILNGVVSKNKIYEMIDTSYDLALK